MDSAIKFPKLFKGPVYQLESMNRHTTFRIGGPADIFCVPQDIDDLCAVIKFVREQGIPYYITGNGSNLLVSDLGYRGVMVKIAGVFNGLRFEGQRVISGAGTDLSFLINQAAHRGLFGLPFAVGIPGTVAGAVVMNAGSATLFMGKKVEKVLVLDCEDLKIKEMSREDLRFQYRKSIIGEKPVIVLEVTLALEEEDPKVIFARIKELLLRRKEVQPLNYPSAGSVFRNPGNTFAGKLIEEAGCKGWQVGDAMVSPVHANFIVNLKAATAMQVRVLMARVQQAVWEKFAVWLEPELKILGEWPPNTPELEQRKSKCASFCF